MTRRGPAERRFSPNKPSSGVAAAWAGVVDLAEDSRAAVADTLVEAAAIQAVAADTRAAAVAALQVARMATARSRPVQ